MRFVAFGLVLSVIGIAACASPTAQMGDLLAARRADQCDVVEATRVAGDSRIETCLLTKCGTATEAACEVPRHFVGPVEVAADTWASAMTMVKDSGVADGTIEVTAGAPAGCSVIAGKSTYRSGSDGPKVCALADELYPLIERAIGRANRAG